MSRRLSGAQLQALTWVAFKDGARPTNRALGQVAEAGLANRPVPGHDPHWRITDSGMRELRSRGLDRPNGRKTTITERAA